ncbi:hypothetical protein AARAC_002811 [Aspergillus arachidicola]|uniref:Uncharacterized protein n=1 Tax=Aspergillus arachidicola TaxID=656916 RepID=A0A2G7FXS9_9EURO|nr:hypothetical protein AARAC_002811 [Aspergillus arachidicola]
MKAMPRYLAIVRYSTLESFGQCDKDIETIIKAKLAGQEISHFNLFLPTSALPPVHYASFVVPYDLPEDVLDDMKVADGLLIHIRRE